MSLENRTTARKFFDSLIINTITLISGCSVFLYLYLFVCSRTWAQRITYILLSYIIIKIVIALLTLCITQDD